MQKLFIGIGVGPGLGASTAERFAQEGFDILLTNLAISGLGRSLRNEIFTDFDQRFLNQNTQRLGKTALLNEIRAADGPTNQSRREL